MIIIIKVGTKIYNSKFKWLLQKQTLLKGLLLFRLLSVNNPVSNMKKNLTIIMSKLNKIF